MLAARMLQRPMVAQGNPAAGFVALTCMITMFIAARASIPQFPQGLSAFVPAGPIRAAESKQTLGSAAASTTLGSGRGEVFAGVAILGAAALAASKRNAVLRLPRAASPGGTGGGQRPREGKQVGDAVWFDVTLSLPLGLGLTMGTQAAGVFVEEVREGGSMFEHNKKHTLSEANFGRQHFVQEGDRLLMVNGQNCSSVDEAVALITGAADQANLQLKFARKLNGNVTMIFPESGTEIAAPGQVRVKQAAQMAGHDVVYNCTDGTCGTCWHKDELTDEVYLLCQEDCKVGLIPSQSMFVEQSIFFDLEDYQARQGSDPNFRNTEPLVLRSCPEVYEEWKKTDVAQGVMAELREKRLNIFEE
mmetsp:Transcript_18930/g.47477  ORF Transcript_18930/g.47477 Transcript_18930/m.47477 type:complete len:361 (-) Transcript_18930:220-1302(-)|eukprot:CAMPEP_0115250230 /NCGR_PEP_ID=MMETSP0270-20121206/43000_1 /TAXON_ID=71861 /ORGANISM="Scrippsiella trochoidea, Strain CCMP3099" /LENGTH=360 /DNA_ID=CAMNT_0002665599 /DNA_START=65 /DNA_END=1147 /DNA_ORIENTATION=+